MLRGVPDIGFSSYAAPTYSRVPEYFRFQEPRLRVGAEGHLMRHGHFARCNAISFQCFGVRCLGAEHPEGVWSIGSGNKSSNSCTQSRFTRYLTTRTEGPYILES